MSARYLKIPVAVPDGVQVAVAGDDYSAKGPAGEARGRFPDCGGKVAVERGDAGFTVRILDDGDRFARALAGTYWRLLANMMEGAAKGFERALELNGVGYRAQAAGDKLTLQLGYSHPVEKTMPPGVSVRTPTPTEIILRGADKAAVGQVAAEIRAVRPPEPYKGKGARYRGERVVLKETKKK